jgi:hypothetical protein
MNLLPRNIVAKSASIGLFLAMLFVLFAVLPFITPAAQQLSVMWPAFLFPVIEIQNVMRSELPLPSSPNPAIVVAPLVATAFLFWWLLFSAVGFLLMRSREGA